jgi:ribosomal protein S24E
MSLEIISEKDNLLFSRKEIVLAYEVEKIPSKEEAKSLIADKFKSKPELVRIQKIEGNFGSNIFRIIVDIYSNQEEFNRLVKKTKKELEDEKKAEEAKKAAEEEARKKAEEESKAKEQITESPTSSQHEPATKEAEKATTEDKKEESENKENKEEKKE